MRSSVDLPQARAVAVSPEIPRCLVPEQSGRIRHRDESGRVHGACRGVVAPPHSSPADVLFFRGSGELLRELGRLHQADHAHAAGTAPEAVRAALLRWSRFRFIDPHQVARREILDCVQHSLRNPHAMGRSIRGLVLAWRPVGREPVSHLSGVAGEKSLQPGGQRFRALGQ